MKFIDIQQQYQRYRSEIDARMQEVMQHSRFIMGPEVQEPEGVLADYVGARHCITTGEWDRESGDSTSRPGDRPWR